MGYDLINSSKQLAKIRTSHLGKLSSSTWISSEIPRCLTTGILKAWRLGPIHPYRQNRTKRQEQWKKPVDPNRSPGHLAATGSDIFKKCFSSDGFFREMFCDNSKIMGKKMYGTSIISSCLTCLSPSLARDCSVSSYYPTLILMVLMLRQFLCMYVYIYNIYIYIYIYIVLYI